jgi:hypothetical protein
MTSVTTWGCWGSAAAGCACAIEKLNENKTLKAKTAGARIVSHKPKPLNLLIVETAFVANMPPALEALKGIPMGRCAPKPPALDDAPNLSKTSRSCSSIFAQPKDLPFSHHSQRRCNRR